MFNQQLEQIELAILVEKTFNNSFELSYNTILINKGEEPIYLPSDKTHKHNRIVFANGFWSSALHEISHWCVAGEKRRNLVDYGYWYQPDGRDEKTQSEFEKVEVKPQALEWIFTQSLGQEFFLSTDNLSGGGASNVDSFKLKIREQVKSYLENGLPLRARIFSEQLRISSANEEKWSKFVVDVSENKILPA